MISLRCRGTNGYPPPSPIDSGLIYILHTTTHRWYGKTEVLCHIWRHDGIEKKVWSDKLLYALLKIFEIDTKKMSTIDVNSRSISVVYPKHFYVYCAGYYDTYHSPRDSQTTCIFYTFSWRFSHSACQQTTCLLMRTTRDFNKFSFKFCKLEIQIFNLWKVRHRRYRMSSSHIYNAQVRSCLVSLCNKNIEIYFYCGSWTFILIYDRLMIIKTFNS